MEFEAAALLAASCGGNDTNSGEPRKIQPFGALLP